MYCPAKKETERVAEALSKLEIRCGVYHAGLQIKQRRETHHRFVRDEIQVGLSGVPTGYINVKTGDVRTKKIPFTDEFHFVLLLSPPL